MKRFLYCFAMLLCLAALSGCKEYGGVYLMNESDVDIYYVEVSGEQIPHGSLPEELLWQMNVNHLYMNRLKPGTALEVSIPDGLVQTFFVFTKETLTEHTLDELVESGRCDNYVIVSERKSGMRNDKDNYIILYPPKEHNIVN